MAIDKKKPSRKVRSNYGAEDMHNARACSKCHKERFEPEWVVAMY